jgi:hypothetical protein
VGVDQELQDWGQLRQFEKPLAGQKVHETLLKMEIQLTTTADQATCNETYAQ